MSPSLDDLSIFAAIARRGGISGAAAELGAPKSSVSRALARLEATLGVELVHRTTRRARLSTAGEALLDRVGPLLAGLGVALSRLPDREAQPAGLLRITCTVDFGATVLAELVTRFLARHPLVRVEVCCNNQVIDLIAGGYDAAIRFSPRRRLTDAGLVGRRLGGLRAQLVAAPRYLAQRGVPRTPRDLEQHAFVTYSGAESVVLEAPGSVERFATRGHIVCDDMFFALAAARAGGGIALLPSFLADNSVSSGELVPVLPRWQVPSGAIYLVYPATRKPPAKLAAFRDFLLAEFPRAPA